jgi:hypothetical protein
MEAGSLVRSPDVSPVLLVGLPKAGIDSFVDYLKNARPDAAKTMNTGLIQAELRSRRRLRGSICCSIMVDPTHVVSFTQIPYVDVAEGNIAKLEQDCDKFFISNEGTPATT